MELYESSGLMGADVRLPGGEEAGRINDFVIDSSDGRIAFLVLYDVPGRETSLIAVPFSTLSIRGENSFVLNTTRERLALGFDFDASGDMNNPRWAGDTYRYFGVEPYWTEQEEMAPISLGPEIMRPNQIRWTGTKCSDIEEGFFHYPLEDNLRHRWLSSFFCLERVPDQPCATSAVGQGDRIVLIT